MAKGGVGPCGSFCDTGSFCANSKNCGCDNQVQIPKCPPQNKLGYQLIKPGEIKNLYRHVMKTDIAILPQIMKEDGAEILLNTLPSGYV
jgi:hypothetical protein